MQKPTDCVRECSHCGYTEKGYYHDGEPTLFCPKCGKLMNFSPAVHRGPDPNPDKFKQY